MMTMWSKANKEYPKARQFTYLDCLKLLVWNHDKCHICIGIFIDLDSILGLTCVILQFMRIFLRLRSILACLGFDCKFTHIKRKA